MDVFVCHHCMLAILLQAIDANRFFITKCQYLLAHRLYGYFCYFSWLFAYSHRTKSASTHHAEHVQLCSTGSGIAACCGYWYGCFRIRKSPVWHTCFCRCVHCYTKQIESADGGGEKQGEQRRSRSIVIGSK